MWYVCFVFGRISICGQKIHRSRKCVTTLTTITHHTCFFSLLLYSAPAKLENSIWKFLTVGRTTAIKMETYISSKDIGTSQLFNSVVFRSGISLRKMQVANSFPTQKTFISLIPHVFICISRMTWYCVFEISHVEQCHASRLTNNVKTIADCHSRCVMMNTHGNEMDITCRQTYGINLLKVFRDSVMTLTVFKWISFGLFIDDYVWAQHKCRNVVRSNLVATSETNGDHWFHFNNFTNREHLRRTDVPSEEKRNYEQLFQIEYSMLIAEMKENALNRQQKRKVSRRTAIFSDSYNNN